MLHKTRVFLSEHNANKLPDREKQQSRHLPNVEPSRDRWVSSSLVSSTCDPFLLIE